MPPETPNSLPRRAVLAGILSLTACGPTPLAPLSGPPRGRAILLRGLLNVFSTGMNVLNAQLRQADFDASVHNYIEWRGLADAVLRADRAGTLARPFVIMGHSYGADDAIVMANTLGRQGVATDLLVTFDPTGGDPVGAGVLRVLNFWQDRDPTFQRTLAGGPGFTGTLENRLVNGESHISIDKQENLHRVVLALMQAMAAERQARAAPLPVLVAPPLPAATAAQPSPPLPRPPAPPVRAGR